MSTTSRPSVSPRVVAAVASASVVGLQVVLPRLFSVLLWYHLGFLAVSLAMLGFAAGGLLVRRRVESTGLPGGGLPLAHLAAGAAVSLPASLALLARLPVDPAALLDAPTDALLLALGVLALAVPATLLGTLACAALDLGTRGAQATSSDGMSTATSPHGARFAGVYAWSFVGGAVGAWIALGALELFGLPRAPLVLAALPLCVAWPARLPAVLAGLVVLLGIALPETVLPLGSRKHFPKVPEERILAVDSSATSHVVFYENDDHHGIIAAAPEWDGSPLPRTIAAAIDSWAITFLVEREPDELPAFLDHHTAGLAFAGAPPDMRALVIGAGGGWDVLGALKAGASHVDAVEIDRHVVHAATERWADFAGNLYTEDPRVDVHVAEGRHFVERRPDARWDRIVLAGVDTFAATQAGAFALAENFLYTREALGTFHDHLQPGGRLFLTRWWFDPPRQTLRLVLTAAEVLRARGVAHPERRIYVAADHGDLRAGNSLTLIQAGRDFTRAELDELDADARRRGARTIYAWDRPSHGVLAEAVDANDPQAWADAWPYRVDPTSDERPFFFEHGRLGTLFRSEGNWIHDRLGGQEVLVTALVILAGAACALLALRERGRGVGGARLAPFGLLGLGYLLVEIPLMQRLALPLGHPVLSVAVVLTTLLLASAVGSAWAARIRPGRAPLVCLLAAALVGGLLVAAWPALHAPLLAAGGVSTVLAVIALLLLPGIALGAAMPCAVGDQGDQPLLVSGAFLWNGMASVVASPLAVMASMSFGFGATLAAGAGCYAAAGTWWLITNRRVG